MMLDNAGLGNGITMHLYGQQLSHLLHLPQAHEAPPLNDTELRWLAKRRALALSVRAPVCMTLPSLHMLPNKFELLLMETSTRVCRSDIVCYVQFYILFSNVFGVMLQQER
jgi:hypothetical protein